MYVITEVGRVTYSRRQNEKLGMAKNGRVKWITTFLVLIYMVFKMSIFKKLSIVLHSVHWYMYMFILTRNSAIVDKPRDAYVQKQCRGWPPKTRPPHIGYHAKFGRSTPNGTSVIKEIAWKFDSSRPAFQGHSRSSEPTQIDPPSVISY